MCVCVRVGYHKLPIWKAISWGEKPRARPASKVTLFKALAKHFFSRCTPYRNAVSSSVDAAKRYWAVVAAKQIGFINVRTTLLSASTLAFFDTSVAYSGPSRSAQRLAKAAVGASVADGPTGPMLTRASSVQVTVTSPSLNSARVLAYAVAWPKFTSPRCLRSALSMEVYGMPLAEVTAVTRAPAAPLTMPHRSTFFPICMVPITSCGGAVG